MHSAAFGWGTISIATKKDVYQEIVVAFPFIPESKGLVSRHDSLDYFACCIHWLALGVLSHRRLYSIGVVHPLGWLLHLKQHKGVKMAAAGTQQSIPVLWTKDRE